MPVPYLSMLFTVPFPFCASKQHEYTSLNDQCLCQPKNKSTFLCMALQQFDFSFQPGIDRKVVRELAGLAFVERCENVILLGPRSGETHRPLPRCESGRCGPSGLFMPQDRLVDADESEAGKPPGAPATTTELCAGLILDEIGYLPMTSEEASLFFRLLNRRYEKASIILTSNKGFADWERCSVITCWQQRSRIGCCITQPH